MGYSGLTAAQRRSAYFANILDHLGSFEKFTPEWNAEAFLKTTKGDPVALRHLLDSFVDTPANAIAEIGIPTLVLSGDEDDDNGSAADLAAALPDATLLLTPGGHMSAVTKPELGQAIAAFLTA
jgi:pimeloyl-ACP methyl ester carboxylesterase